MGCGQSPPLRSDGLKRLLRSKLGSHDEEDVNPMDGVANLVDVMFVLVVGFMLALIINWNLDVGAIAHLAPEEQVEEKALKFDGDSLEELDSESSNIDSDALEKLGSVYFDEETGKYYVIVD